MRRYFVAAIVGFAPLAHTAEAQVVQTSAESPVAAPIETVTGVELLRRAQAFAARKQWGDAKTAVTQAVSVDPENSHVYYLFRSQVHRLEGDYDDAVRDAEMVMALRPQVAEGYLLRAMVWTKRGLHQPAILDLSKVLELNPETTAAYVMRGNAYRALRDDARALADYDEALRRNPNDAVLKWHRGNVYWQLGNHAEAQADFEAALAIAPQKPELLLTASSFHATCADSACRDARKAFDYAKRAGEATGWTDWTAVAALADAYAEAGDFANAAQMIAKAMEAAPADQHDVLKERAALFQAGKPHRTTPR
ncbi:MAG: tetratricopeptide repeat protein [Pirellulales bacterium]